MTKAIKEDIRGLMRDIKILTHIEVLKERERVKSLVGDLPVILRGGFIRIRDSREGRKERNDLLKYYALLNEEIGKRTDKNGKFFAN